MAEDRLLRFRLAGESFALRLDDAGSLVKLPAISPVPGAPPEIGGVADVRGRVVTLVRLTRLAGLPDPGGDAPRALLLAPPRAHLALEVANDIDLIVTDLDRARDAGDRSAREERALRGVLTAEGVLLNLIDPHAVAAACERHVRDRFHLAG